LCVTRLDTWFKNKIFVRKRSLKKFQEEADSSPRTLNLIDSIDLSELIVVLI